MKQIRVEWCENWIRAKFEKLAKLGANGIYTRLFWKEAEKAGLYVKDTYGDDAPMSEALGRLCSVVDVVDQKGYTVYSVFKLKGTKLAENERLLG